ncbi:MAG: hypothetical protein KF884_04665 [Fimbriimonadaceae bacterium]|nr:hypothetical protein [Fimbriimonadaceae bacterium]QYK59380.1 MAG: hypothetical protein KF884_04665 [Fimbriimonadaceae bacterium]
MEPALRARVGFGVCVASALLAATSLLPAFSGPLAVPWPLFVGAATYLLGAGMIVTAVRSPVARAWLGWLRLVRIGFALVVLAIIFRMSQSG